MFERIEPSKPDKRRNLFRRKKNAPAVGRIGLYENLADETPQEQLTPSDLRKIIIGSFRFSQGNEALQRDLLKAVAANNIGKITPHNIANAIPRAKESAAKIIASNVVHQPTSANISQVDEFAEDLTSYIDGDLPNLKYMAAQVIEGDYRYIVKKGGRKRQSNGKITPNSDPYLSHFVHYILLDGETGVPEYDQIFDQMREIYYGSSPQELEVLDTSFDEMIETYIKHHPEQEEKVRASLDPRVEAQAA